MQRTLNQSSRREEDSFGRPPSLGIKAPAKFRIAFGDCRTLRRLVDRNIDSRRLKRTLRFPFFGEPATASDVSTFRSPPAA
jgi:hypothetical protein